MTIPALVLIDRIKILSTEYRQQALDANRVWNELRKGREIYARKMAARDAAEFERIADALDRLVQP